MRGRGRCLQLRPTAVTHSWLPTAATCSCLRLRSTAMRTYSCTCSPPNAALQRRHVGRTGTVFRLCCAAACASSAAAAPTAAPAACGGRRSQLHLLSTKRGTRVHAGVDRVDHLSSAMFPLIDPPPPPLCGFGSTKYALTAAPAGTGGRRPVTPRRTAWPGWSCCRRGQSHLFDLCNRAQSLPRPFLGLSANCCRSLLTVHRLSLPFLDLSLPFTGVSCPFAAYSLPFFWPFNVL